MNKPYLICIFLFLSISGCKEFETLEYEDDPRLYFYNSTYAQSDSIAQTFFILPDAQQRDTVFIDVRTMGYPVNQDRPFTFIQNNVGEVGAALAGTDFVSFDDPEVKDRMIIPAGEVKVQVPVIFLKSDAIQKGVVRMKLTFAETEYFKPGINKWSTFVVTSTAVAMKPTNWDKDWIYTFGTWGSVKMKFIIDYVGFTDFDSNFSDSSYRNYLKTKARQKLFEYNADPSHDWLKENDDTYVEFPS